MPRQTKDHAAASEIRPRIIRAALELIETEGFNAVTAPRLAAEIGLRRTVIYYYFEDIDQILIEAVSLAYQEQKEAAIKSMATKDATEALWDFFSVAAAPLSELMALAIRNERFKVAYVSMVADFRSHITAAIKQQYVSEGVTPELEPESLALLIQIASSAIAAEKRMGLTSGHIGLREYIEAKFIHVPSPRPHERT